ncbi:acetyl-CoA acetyltransferase [Pseudonocardia abyssalis]|uniref:acetyl-CoA acetyltransferase n=1 Tax=Pseudonocardia abyssalis TaxID=2792008 RepID=UPI001CF6C172|nr:acetyl-CoA acetyltransferase [Pseudonocardia abyssalis]
MTSDERRPVLVGVGQVRGNRERTVEGAREPFPLILDAVRAAATDGGIDLTTLDAVCTVHVASWAYDDLAARVAREIGATPRHTLDTGVGGQRPAELLEQAAARIAAGDSRVALIVGGEAQASVQALWRNGIDPAERWSATPGGPPSFEETGLRSDAMTRTGLVLPTRVYPLFENALRAARGESPERAARASAELYAAFSQVAATNPAAWNPEPRSADEIATVGPGNRMVCEPYPLSLNAMPMVDQAAAVVVTSLAAAREAGVPEDRIVHVWGGAGAHDAADALARPSFAASAALSDVLDRTLAATGLSAADLDVIDVYSCFPVVPKLVGEHLGIAPPVGVTGGHSAFGGPLSSYTLHALVAVTEHLRRERGTALVHGNGGYLTHEHALVVSTTPHDYVGDPESRDTAGPGPAVRERVDGEEVTVETATVEHGRDGTPAQGFLVARTAEGARYCASTVPGDVASARALSLGLGETVGRRVRATTTGEHVVVETT